MNRKELFKPEYTSEELEELFGWFEQRMDRLPKSMQIDEATYTGDLRRTVKSYIRLLRTMKLTVSQSGYVAHLLLIRERLREAWEGGEPKD